MIASDPVSSFPPIRCLEQFLLSKDDVPAPGGWTTVRHGEWKLQHDASLRARALLNGDGDQIGWLVGLPTLDGHMVGNSFAIRSHAELYRLGGPWIAFDLERGEVYGDSQGHLTIVYSKDAQVVATNPEFVPGARTDEALSALMDIPRKNNWFPFGLTPKQGVSRLLPNHYLDLDQWRAHRHGPDVSYCETLEPMSVEEASEAVARVVKQNIAAIARDRPLRMSLSAGYDSRLLLACAREHKDQLECVSHRFHVTTGELDLKVSSWLAEAHGLSHTILHERPTTTQQQEDWLYRTGRSVAGGNYRNVGTHYLEHIGGSTLTGHGGGLFKGGYYVRHPERLAETPTVEVLMECLNLPTNEVVLAAAQRWLDEVPTDRPKLILDLLLIEQAASCWGGVLRHGSAPLNFWPLAHRDLSEVTFRLSLQAKQEKAVHTRVIEREWPELLEIPINEWWGWRKPVKGLSERLTGAVYSLRKKMALQTRFRHMKNWVTSPLQDIAR